MLIKVLSSVLLFSGLLAFHPTPKGEAVVKKMYDRYKNTWYRNFTFDQTTQIYQNDSLKKSDTWHEAMVYPDQLRIDFGAIDSGNAVLFRGDSTYRFKQGKLATAVKGENELVFLLGGMFFHPFEEVKAKFKALGYDLSQYREDVWKGQPVYVIGSKDGDGSNEIWIEQKRLLIVRMIAYKNKVKQDFWFEEYLPLGKAWVETKCSFYFDDKLRQVEIYHDCKANEKIDPRVFEPSAFGTVHWYKK
jgi:hypothetical protein